MEFEVFRGHKDKFDPQPIKKYPNTATQEVEKTSLYMQKYNYL